MELNCVCVSVLSEMEAGVELGLKVKVKIGWSQKLPLKVFKLLKLQYQKYYLLQCPTQLFLFLFFIN